MCVCVCVVIYLFASLFGLIDDEQGINTRVCTVCRMFVGRSGTSVPVTMSHAVCVTEFAQCAALSLTDPEYPYQSRYLLQYVYRSLYGVSNVCGQIRDLRTSDEISFTICK